MTRTQKATAIVMGIATLALIGWDIAIFIEDTPGDTISELILAWSYHMPILPYAFGVLAGHFFLPRKNHTRGIKTLVASGIAVFVAGFLGASIPPAFALVVGAIAGSLLWNQGAPDTD